jgi:hypothetical protein
MPRRAIGIFAAAAVALGAGAGLAADAVVLYDHADDPILKLGRVVYPGGKTLELSVGIGSAAFRRAGDPADIVYTLSDRGPNFTCGDVPAIAGVPAESLCKGVKGRLYPVPAYTPSIYGLRLKADGTFSVFDVIAIKDKDGTPIDGLLNPLTVAKTEVPLDGFGNALPYSASAIDAEGLVRLADGSWWIGEENGPSIVHVAIDGRIQERVVPAGSEKDFAGANYKITGGLPAILAKRQTNRGIESMAVSPDEAFLYFMVQNPLANPDAKAYAQARNTRLFKYDRRARRVVGEYVYELDDPQSFRLDPSKKQSDPRISELMALGTDRLLVLERTEKTTKLHEVALAGATNILAGKWDDAATAPSLEQTSAAAAGIASVAKVLRFDSADHPEVPTKLEGLALLPDGALFMINDDDFGITGEKTRVVILSGDGLKTAGR